MEDKYFNKTNKVYTKIENSKKDSSFSQQNLFRKTNVGNGSYYSFAERVEQSPFLVSFEQQKNLKNNNKVDKKVINSYIPNKDKLLIPKPEKVHKAIDIYKNLIEVKKKVSTVDLGIQSDNIDYEEKEKIFLPQKLGKDVGTQILDGELFNFDRDVQPLLMVIVGKTLEQSVLEIEQEDEAKNLRNAKLMYYQKSQEEQERINSLENYEKQKKMNNDIKKEERKQLREVRKKTQKQLISRFISKTYLQNLINNSIIDLKRRGFFNDFVSIGVKTKTNKIITSGCQKLDIIQNNVKNYINDKLISKLTNLEKKHKNSIDDRHLYLIKLAKQKELLKKRAEEEKIRMEQARIERRRQRKINRIKNEIKTSMVDNPVIKDVPNNCDMVEIGNYFNNEEPYIGIYGSFMGILIVTLSFIQRDFYTDESLYNFDNISEIMKLIFDETQCCLTLHFNEVAYNKVKEIIKQSKKEENPEGEEEEAKDFEFTDLKLLQDISKNCWNEICDVLENMEYNNDIIFKSYIEDFSIIAKDNEGNEGIPLIKDDNFYKIIVDILIEMCSKSSYSEHYKLIFDKNVVQEEEAKAEDEKDEEDEKKNNNKSNEIKIKTFEDILNEYDAVCMFEPEIPTSKIINTCDYMRQNRRKTVPSPEFDLSLLRLKAYKNNPDVHNVLFYDRIAEFFLRNKIFEMALSQFVYVTNIENDIPDMFKTFNANYDEIIDNSRISKTIQVYHFINEKTKVNEGEEE